MPRGDAGEECGVVGCDRAKPVEKHAPLLGVVVGGGWNRPGLFELETLVDEHGGVAAVVEN